MKQERNYLSKWTFGIWTFTCLLLHFAFDALSVKNAYVTLGIIYVAVLCLVALVKHFVEIDAQQITSGFTLLGKSLYKKSYLRNKISNIDITNRKYVSHFLGWGYRLRGKKIGYISPNVDGTLIFDHDRNQIYISISNLNQIRSLLKG